MHITLATGTRVAPSSDLSTHRPTIAELIAQYLEVTAPRLSARSAQQTEAILGFFTDCLDSYGYLGLADADRRRFDACYNAQGTMHREFCELFGPQYVLENVEEFLGHYMIRKVICGQALLRAAGPAIAGFIEWLRHGGQVDEVEAELALARGKVAGRKLPVAVALSVRLHAIADESDPEAPRDEVIEDTFTVTMVRPGGEFFVEGEMPHREYGPISVPEDVAQTMQIGWKFWGILARSGDLWRPIDLGFVYPER